MHACRQVRGISTQSEHAFVFLHGQVLITVSDCLLFKYTFLFGLCVALCWSVLVCVSRVYMGMHSVLVSLSSDYYETIFYSWL